MSDPPAVAQTAQPAGLEGGMIIRTRLSGASISLEARVPTKDRPVPTRETVSFELLPTEERTDLREFLMHTASAKDSHGLRERERRAPALWRGGEVQLNRLAAGARARLDGELSGAGLED